MPSPFEAFFWSDAHGERELAPTLKAQRVALEKAFDPSFEIAV